MSGQKYLMTSLQLEQLLADIYKNPGIMLTDFMPERFIAVENFDALKAKAAEMGQELPPDLLVSKNSILR